MSERFTTTKPEVSPVDLFSAASKFRRRGVLVEEGEASSIEYRGKFTEGDEKHSIALSFAEVIGYESIKISIDGVQATVKKVTEPNTSDFDEFRIEDKDKLPENILQILMSAKDDREAMEKLQKPKAS